MGAHVRCKPHFDCRDGVNREGVGEVVESAVRCLIPGQERFDVQVERQEFANGAVVLGAIRPMDRRNPGEDGIDLPGAVDLSLDLRGYRPKGASVRTRRARRGYRSAADLLDDPFSKLSVTPGSPRAGHGQLESSRAHDRVVAGDAIAIERRPNRAWPRARRWRCMQRSALSRREY
jgi:hypothetical protein